MFRHISYVPTRLVHYPQEPLGGLSYFPSKSEGCKIMAWWMKIAVFRLVFRTPWFDVESLNSLVI
jgi:hypothetical protein